MVLTQSDGKLHRTPIPARLKPVLAVLLAAREHAEQVGAELWDFAEEISVLRIAGATNGDLRLLLSQEIVAHAEEVTAATANRRKFRAIGKLRLPDGSCFVLTPRGEAFARATVSAPPGDKLTPSNGNGKSKNKTLKPRWLPEQRELWLGEQLVKRFRRPAPNQETVLAVFQEDDWPVRVDDPLTKRDERDATQCLHDTINHLNRNQLVPLIQFSGDGTGKGIRWRIRNAD